MGIWITVIILVGLIIGILIYYTQKPKELQIEIKRLRKSLISGGLNFEQFEYKIESLRKEITYQRELLKSGKLKEKDMEKYLENLENKIDNITKELLSENSKNK